MWRLNIDIFYEGLNETPSPTEDIWISLEGSQEDTVLSDEDITVPYFGKYFSFDILSSLQMLSFSSFLIKSLNFF